MTRGRSTREDDPTADEPPRRRAAAAERMLDLIRAARDRDWRWKPSDPGGERGGLERTVRSWLASLGDRGRGG